MSRMPSCMESNFQKSLPKGWRIDSAFEMPIPGWDCDIYVCRITDGINVRYLETDHGRVKEASKAKIKNRIRTYKRLHEQSLAWLESSLDLKGKTCER